MSYIPDIGYEGIANVTIIASDGENSTTEYALIAIGTNTFEDSWINGTHYTSAEADKKVYFNFSPLQRVFGSTLNISNISGTIIDTIDSYLYNSTRCDYTLELLQLLITDGYINVKKFLNIYMKKLYVNMIPVKLINTLEQMLTIKIDDRISIDKLVILYN